MPNIMLFLLYRSTYPLSNSYCRLLIALIGTFLLSVNGSNLQAQNRALAVVYDNSGSMRDAGQCEGINYALQVMVGLLHPKDELYVYKMDAANGNFMNLNSKHSTIKNIANIYDCNAKATPFDAVINAKDKLTQSSRKDKYLVILSDGLITDKQFQQKYSTDLRQFVEQTGARIIFLNVNDQNSPLDDYFSQSQTPQQTLRKAGNFEQVIKTMEQIGATIMTLSGNGVAFKPIGTKLEINSPVPLKKIIVLSQETSKNAALPTIKNVVQNGKPLYIQDTYNAQKNGSNPKTKQSYQMTGLITHVAASQSENAIIPKGNISIEFVGIPDPSKVKILPEVAAKLLVDIEGSVKASNGNQRQVCDTVKQMRIIAKLLDLNDQPLDLAVLKQSKLYAINENNKQKTPLILDEKNGKFTANIPLIGQQIIVSVTAEYAGYFYFKSQVISISKDACPNPIANISASKNSIVAHVLNLDNAESIVVLPQITIGKSEARPPTAAEMNDLLIEQISNGSDIKLSVENTDDGKMVIKPQGAWCACFTKTGKADITLQLKSKNPNIQIGNNNKIKVSVEIMDASFWAKCGWLIVGIICLLFGLWYIIGLIRKPRFCRGAEIVFSRITPLQTQKPRSYPLSTHFFSRYFIPYLPEKQIVGTVKFVAGARCSHVLIAKDAQTDNMFVSGFPVENPKVKDLRLSNGEKLEVARAGQSKEIYEYRKIS